MGKNDELHRKVDIISQYRGSYYIYLIIELKQEVI